MPSLIEIRITYDYEIRAYRADNVTGAKIVNGNEYRLSVQNWGNNLTVYVKTHKNNGETHTSTHQGAYLDVYIEDAYLVEVSAKAGPPSNVETAVPARIFCVAGAKTDSGIEDEPRPDVFNLAVSFINLSIAGKSAAAAAAMEDLTEIRSSAPPAFPGDAYRLATERTSRVTKITGKITSTLGVELEITGEEIVGESLGIQSNAMESDMLLPGSAPSAELRVTLRGETTGNNLIGYGAEIELTYHIQRHDEFWCDIPLGTFTVVSFADADNGVTVTAYDHMLQLGKVKSTGLAFTAGRVYEIAEIMRTLAAAANVEWDGVVPRETGEMLPTFAVQSVLDHIETARDLLSYVAQAICCIAFIDRFGVLKLRRPPKYNETPAAKYTPQQIITAQISRAEYRLAHLETSVTFTEPGATETVQYEFDVAASGVSASLPENPLWDCISGYTSIDSKKSGAAPYLQRLANLIALVSYNPGEIGIYGDPAIDLLDWLFIRTKEAEWLYPTTFTDWQYRGQHALSACGTDAITTIPT